MLIFDRVSFAYEDSRPVLQELSFHIHIGERVGLIGANGAGKSTLMKAALGLVPAEGTIMVCGMALERKTLAVIRKRLGYVLQDANDQMFMPTVLEDMVFGPVNYGMSREEAETLARRTLSRLHAEDLIDRQNHKLSGGEKRMAAIATVLAMQPEILMMDEPSSSLDPRNRRELIAALNDLTETKLIATHDLDLVCRTCDRVLLLSGGKIAADGPAEAILSDRELLEANGL